MRLRIVFLSLLIAFSVVAGLRADDREAIRKTALDYVEGWYTGDATRIGGALHPQLVKRRMVAEPLSGESLLRDLDRETMVRLTRDGAGKSTEGAHVTPQVTVFDVDGDIATARVISRDFVDYLHLVRWNGRWVILSVLWDVR